MPKEGSILYQINDYVVYGGNGVCKVNEIGTLDIGGIDKEKLYYTLEPLYSKSSKVYTPIDNVKVIMRNILSKEEARVLIDDIPNIETIWAADDKKTEAVYKESMKMYDCREWIKIIKTLYLKKQERIEQGKKITNTDERYLQIAENSLYGELAITLGMSKDKVEDFIGTRVEQLTELELML